jgi:hypothetical protein
MYLKLVSEGAVTPTKTNVRPQPQRNTQVPEHRRSPTRAPETKNRKQKKASWGQKATSGQSTNRPRIITSRLKRVWVELTQRGKENQI